MYSFNSRIRYSECGADGYLTIVALLNYFQDCSTFQSEDLGVGVAALHERGTLWVVNSWQIDIMRLPRLCDRVEIYTRPYDCRGFFGKRNFYMKNEDGEYLAKADSLWTYISAKDATPVRIDRDILEAYGREPKIEMEYLGRKISVPGDTEGWSHSLEEAIPVNDHLLDTNKHVNNGKYVELAAGLIPEELRPDRVRVEYRKQAFLGDTIFPEVYRQGEQVIVKLADTDGNAYSIVEFSKIDR